MSGEVPDALTELIRVLRDQLAQKDERIAWLQARLKEASAAGAEQGRRLDELSQRMSELAENLARQQHLLEVVATREAHAASPTGSELPCAAPALEVLAPQIAAAGEAPPTGPLGGPAQPQPDATAALEEAEEAPPPDLSDAIQAIATSVVQAAQRKAAEEAELPTEGEKEITARIARRDLQRGHRAQGTKRGIWPFRQRSDRSA